MNRLILLIALALSSQASAIPLQTWPQWTAQDPVTARQVPPMALVARCANLDLLCVLEVDQTTGALPVNAVITITYSGETGNPVPSEAAYVAGVDANGDLQGLATDTDGKLQVEITESVLPAGAATEEKQDDQIVLETSIDGKMTNVVSNTGDILTDTTSIDGKMTDVVSDLNVIMTEVGEINTKTPLLGQSTMAGSTPVTIASDQSTLNVQSTNLDIRDLDYTTDSVTAHQGGTWNVNNISGTVSLPTGASTSAKQDDIISELQSVNTELQNVNTELQDVNTELQDIADKIVNSTDLSVKNKIIVDYSISNVTTSAYTQIVPAVTGKVTKMTIFEGSGQGMILAAGGVSNEVDLFYIPPGGVDGEVSLHIPAGTRLSLKAINGTANSGRFIANFTGP
jgi:hypothetical protein